MNHPIWRLATLLGILLCSACGPSDTTSGTGGTGTSTTTGGGGTGGQTTTTVTTGGGGAGGQTTTTTITTTSGTGGMGPCVFGQSSFGNCVSAIEERSMKIKL